MDRILLAMWCACCCVWGASKADAESVVIRGVPHVEQKPDFCGEACLASWLQKLGQSADQDAVFDLSGLSPDAARGCYTKELVTAVKAAGINPGQVWYRVSAKKSRQQMQTLWEESLDDLRREIPSIICMRSSGHENATEHFRLLLGYDEKNDQVIYHEPAQRQGAYQTMSRGDWMSQWPLKYQSDEWLVIRIRLAAERLMPLKRSAEPTDADYAQHLMQLKSQLPDSDFTVLIEKPFVVIGDESPERVRQRAAQTVRWATTRLKKQFFANDPDRILNIWLFRDRESYEKNAVRLFGRKPSTPYGYYSSSDNALVMNIATGGGTLVHEIVHPFVERNFPNCPAWFNEGLGSLFEQSASRGQNIVGLTNWRLAGLQEAIKNGRVPTFAALCGTTTREFYDQDPGTNYAQARYLCYYLQEKNLLEKYYRQFSLNRKNDPSGYRTLQDVLGTNDMAGFQKQWESYVAKLRFP